MPLQICSDTFLVNVIGNLICTVKLKSRESIHAVYGTTTIMKTFLYTPGTGVDTSNTNFGFRAVYTPSTFPTGITFTGSFDPILPDVLGNLTEAREAIYNGILEVNSDTYLGGDTSIIVELIFNPGT